MATAEQVEKIENDVAQSLLTFTGIVEQLGAGGAREGMAEKADAIIAALQALKSVLPRSTAKATIDRGFASAQSRPPPTEKHIWPVDMSASVQTKKSAGEPIGTGSAGAWPADLSASVAEKRRAAKRTKGR